MKFQLVPNRDSSSQSPESEEPNKKSGDGPLWLAVGVIVILVTKYILLSKYYFNKPLINEMSRPKKSIESSDTETLDY